MDYLAKKILFINLNTQTHEIKSFPDLKKYIGGVSLGLKLLSSHAVNDSIIFSIGPLNGFFPYASKTSVVFKNSNTVEDDYLGGSLSFRLRFSGLNAVVIQGTSKQPVFLDISDGGVSFETQDTDIETLGLPGRRSVIENGNGKLLLDNYFESSENTLGEKLQEKNVAGIVITGTKTFLIKHEEKYNELFKKLLGRANDLSVKKGENSSCSGCPMGCEKSKIGESGGDIILHSLTACQYAESIYTDIGTVFSCLNILGYDYTHEDIENLPKLISNL